MEVHHSRATRHLPSFDFSEIRDSKAPNTVEKLLPQDNHSSREGTQRKVRLLYTYRRVQQGIYVASPADRGGAKGARRLIPLCPVSLLDARRCVSMGTAAQATRKACLEVMV